MASVSDFNKIRSKGYKAWRILSAPKVWSNIYVEREKRLRGLRGAIIFPEQFFLGDLNQVYKVVVTKAGQTVTSHIQIIHDFRIVGVAGFLTSLDEIVEFENTHNDNSKIHLMRVGAHQSNDSTFYTHDFFTNSKDAIKHQAKLQASLL